MNYDAAAAAAYIYYYYLFIDHIKSILQIAGYIVNNNMVQQKYIHYSNKLKVKYYLKVIFFTH